MLPNARRFFSRAAEEQASLLYANTAASLAIHRLLNITVSVSLASSYPIVPGFLPSI